MHNARNLDQLADQDQHDGWLLCMDCAPLGLPLCSECEYGSSASGKPVKKGSALA